MGISEFTDTLRDTLSAILAGLFLMGIGAYRAHRRTIETRLSVLEKWREKVKGYFTAKGIDL